MAQTFSTELAPTQATPPSVPSTYSAYGARDHRYRASITLAAQASGDTIVLANVPAGVCFEYGVIVSDTSLSTATVSVGNSTSAAKYKAAATFTATDTPTLFGKAAAVAGSASSAVEQVLLTVGTAALPASGQLVVDLYFSSPI